MGSKGVLEASSDPRELLATALSLARDGGRADHETLRRALESPGFLGRLDSEEEYSDHPDRTLRVGLVLKALGKRQEDSAHGVLVALTQHTGFCSSPERVDLLIEATAQVRPVPKELVAFWDRHSAPWDGYTPLTIRTLLENGTNPAMELLEKKMADPAHPKEHRIAWLRSDVLTHRCDVGLLKACNRMAKGSIAEELRVNLLEVVFDYRPLEWYRSSSPRPEPPPWTELTREGRDQLRQLSAFGLGAFEGDKALTEAIESTLGEIGPHGE